MNSYYEIYSSNVGSPSAVVMYRGKTVLYKRDPGCEWEPWLTVVTRNIKKIKSPGTWLFKGHLPRAEVVALRLRGIL